MAEHNKYYICASCKMCIHIPHMCKQSDLSKLNIMAPHSVRCVRAIQKYYPVPLITRRSRLRNAFVSHFEVIFIRSIDTQGN